MNRSEDTGGPDVIERPDWELGDIIDELGVRGADIKLGCYIQALDILDDELKYLDDERQAAVTRRDHNELWTLKYREHRLRVAELSLAVGRFWDKS